MASKPLAVIATVAVAAGTLTLVDATANAAPANATPAHTASFSCDADTIYTQNESGVIRSVDVSEGAALGGVQAEGQRANGLGISADGNIAYTLDNADGTEGDRKQIAIYDGVSDTTETKALGDPDVPGVIIRGAVSPSTGIYYYAGSGKASYFGAYDPAADAVIGQVGVLRTGIDGNGDFAFGADGELYVLADRDIFVVRAEDVPTRAGTGDVPLTHVTQLPPRTQGNGIAFGADGKLFVSQRDAISEVNLATGELTRTISTPGFSNTDLSSCSFPNTLTLQKDVVDRYADGDQFTLAVGEGDTTLVSATTSGTAPGLQHEVAGPVFVEAGGVYTVSESAAGSTDLARYDSSVACVTSGGSPVETNGGAGSWSLTFPESAIGENVLCTITNTAEPRVPALALQKTSTPAGGDAVRPGDTVRYTVTATNTGTGDYTAENPAVVLDDLSAVLDDADYNGDLQASRPGALSSESPLLAWNGALAAGDSVELSYTVTLKGGGDGTARNVAWQPRDPGNPVPPVCAPPQNGVDPVTGEPCAEVTHELPKLRIDKKADKTHLSQIGEKVTYTVTVTNDGPGAYTAEAPASFTDDLSDVLDAASFTGDASASAGTVSYAEPTLSWQGALAAGDSATVTYTVTYTGEGDRTLRNVACIPEAETAPGASSCAAVQIPGADLAQWKQVEASDDPVVAGSTLTYTLFFRNAGEAVATVDSIDDLTHVTDDADVTVEPASDGLAVARDGNRIAITGEVAPGATAAVSYQVTVKPDGQRGDDISANFLLWNDSDNPPVPPQEPVCAPSDPQLPDCTSTPIAAVVYAKSVEASTDPVETGTVLTYTIVIDSIGQDTIPVSREDVLVDVLDDAVLTSAPVSDVESVTVSDVVDGRFQIGGELAAGETATIAYQVTVKPETERGNDSADNFLVVPGETPPVECAEDSDQCTVTPLPNVQVSKSSDPESGSAVNAGQQIVYTLTFANTGRAASAVDYTDDLAAVLDDADLTAAPVSSDPALVVTDGADGSVRAHGTLDAGQTVTVSYAVTVKPDGQRGDNVLRNVVAETGTPDPKCEDAGVSCTEHPVGELVDGKSVDPTSGTTVQEGAELTYTLHFENTGKAPVEVNREDALADVLDDAEVTGQPVAAGGALAVSEIVDGRFQVTGTLQPGQSEVVTYTVTVKADGERGDDRLANFLLNPGEEPPAECLPVDGERADCTVNHVNDVVVVKSSDPESGSQVRPGEAVTYTVTFENTSANPDAAPVAVDYTDHMVDVLDDATLTGDPVVSHADLSAVVEGDTIRIAGSVPTGAVYTVSYTVTVKEYAEQGDAHLGNVVAVTGEAPVCAPGSPLCTEHDVPPAPPVPPVPPVIELPFTPTGLPITGGEIPAATTLAAFALLLAGGGVLMHSRRRRKAAAGGTREQHAPLG